MKKWPFYISWVALILGCIVWGIITRSSFIQVSGDVEDLNSLWYAYLQYMEKNPEIVSAYQKNAQEIIGKADCIVLGKFTGQREYKNKTFLSEFEVAEVIVGDSAFQDTTIAIYEPIVYEDYNKFYSNIYSQANPNDWGFMQNKFNITEDNHFYLAATKSRYQYGNTLLLSGKEYILLLNQRTLADGMALPEKMEFLPIDSPYSKLDVTKSISVEQYEIPEKYLTLEEASEYEILVTDIDLFGQYVTTKKDILEELEIRRSLSYK